LTSDVFTVCVETITVVRIQQPYLNIHITGLLISPIQFAWGPLAILCVISILSQSHYRHFYQIVVCVAHLYGVALYYATNWADSQFSGVSYSRPEFLYFWVYYAGFNLPWAIVPLGVFLMILSYSNATY
jgi:hypothetical protein